MISMSANAVRPERYRRFYPDLAIEDEFGAAVGFVAPSFFECSMAG